MTSETRPPPVRKRMIGEYQVVRMIGSGSFANVWQCVHQTTKQVVAIKSIRKDKIKMNKKHQENLESEVSIMRNLKHPNIVEFLELRTTARHIYLVLDFCGGGDLSRFIKKHGAMSEATARIFLRQLASGLEFLHSRNLVHRDLKPQNLLLSADVPDAHLKIADFGFARPLGPHMMAATLCGSPLYMAPEIQRHQKYDAKADLWSVGTILFEMVTAKPPFQASSQAHLLHQIEHTQLDFPPEMSPPLQDLLRGLLKRNPLERMSYSEFFDHPFLVSTPSLAASLCPASPTSPAAKAEQGEAQTPPGKKLRKGKKGKRGKKGPSSKTQGKAGQAKVPETKPEQRQPASVGDGMATQPTQNKAGSMPMKVSTQTPGGPDSSKQARGQGPDLAREASVVKLRSHDEDEMKPLQNGARSMNQVDPVASPKKSTKVAALAPSARSHLSFQPQPPMTVKQPDTATAAASDSPAVRPPEVNTIDTSATPANSNTAGTRIQRASSHSSLSSSRATDRPISPGDADYVVVDEQQQIQKQRSQQASAAGRVSPIAEDFVVSASGHGTVSELDAVAAFQAMSKRALLVAQCAERTLRVQQSPGSYASALGLYCKALLLFQSTIKGIGQWTRDSSKTGVTISQNTMTELKELVHWLRRMQSHIRDKAAKWRRRVEESQSDVEVTVAEQHMWDWSVSLGKEAAVDEMMELPAQALTKYKRAYRLMEQLAVEVDRALRTRDTCPDGQELGGKGGLLHDRSALKHTMASLYTRIDLIQRQQQRVK